MSFQELYTYRINCDNCIVSEIKIDIYKVPNYTVEIDTNLLKHSLKQDYNMLINKKEFPWTEIVKKLNDANWQYINANTNYADPNYLYHFLCPNCIMKDVLE